MFFFLTAIKLFSAGQLFSPPRVRQFLGACLPIRQNAPYANEFCLSVCVCVCVCVTIVIFARTIRDRDTRFSLLDTLAQKTSTGTRMTFIVHDLQGHPRSNVKGRYG